MAASLRSMSSRDRMDTPLAPWGDPRSLVLLVEDHEDTRFMLRTLLELRGLEVIEAVNGEQAVELAERMRPCVVLMDGVLPKLDGYSATRRIRQIPSLRDVAIVVLSGHAGTDFRNLAFAAGCNDYLVKPIDFDQLYRVLDRYCLQKEQALKL